MSCIRFVPRILLLILLLAATGAVAQNPQSLGEIRPNPSWQKSTIAVVSFSTSNTSLENETIPRIIRNDLMLSGFFKMPKDQILANRQNLIDHRKGSIDFDWWRSQGIEHYMMGEVREEGPDLRVRVLLYEIASGRQILTRQFIDRKERLRDLAHQISDATILQLKGVDGVCRTRILFVTEQIPGVKEIGMMDWDGFGARPITNLSKIATTPVWGANGTEYYFTSYHGNRANIYGQQLVPDAAMRLNPGQMWTIAAFGGTNHSPAWNSSSRRIAMVLSKDGNSEVYSVGRDGTNPGRLTQTKATEGSPAWSPDGSRIAFTSNEAGGVHVFVMNADGSGKRRVTTRGSWNSDVSWSPRGDKLAFVSRTGASNDIFTCNPDGSGIRRLTEGSRNNESPSWAPNGTHLTFASDRTGMWQIYIMLDDGSNQTQLTNSGRNNMPDWGPFIK